MESDRYKSHLLIIPIHMAVTVLCITDSFRDPLLDMCYSRKDSGSLRVGTSSMSIAHDTNESESEPDI